MASMDYDQLQLVAFRLGGEEYAVPVQNVESIIKLTRPTRVPGAPFHVRGVINLRGKVISIFDLRRRFGMAPAEDEAEARILVVHHDGLNTGVLVDGVSEVLTLGGGDLQAAPSELGGAGRTVAGICRVEDRLVIILDLAAVFDEQALASAPTVTAAMAEQAVEATTLHAATVEDVEEGAADEAADEVTAATPVGAGAE